MLVEFEFVQFRVEVGQIWTDMAKLGSNPVNFGQVPPSWDQFGQTRSTSAIFCRTRSHRQFRPNLAITAPKISSVPIKSLLIDATSSGHLLDDPARRPRRRHNPHPMRARPKSRRVRWRRPSGPRGAMPRRPTARPASARPRRLGAVRPRVCWGDLPRWAPQQDGGGGGAAGGGELGAFCRTSIKVGRRRAAGARVLQANGAPL